MSGIERNKRYIIVKRDRKYQKESGRPRQRTEIKRVGDRDRDNEIQREAKKGRYKSP